MRQIGIVGAALAALVLLAHPRPAAARHPKEKLMWEAAQALYGVGLSIKRTKRATTIKPGQLTQRRWNQYVKDVYLPALQSAPFSRNLPGPRFRTDYKDPKWTIRAPVKRAHILFETNMKHALCSHIAMLIYYKDQQLKPRFQRQAWCASQAIVEAYAPIYEFRGKPVTWKAPAERSTASLDTEIFKAGADGHYPIFITVAGQSTAVSADGHAMATSLLSHAKQPYADKTYDKAKRYTEAKYKVFRREEKKALVRQKRAARGRWAIFGEHRFHTWKVYQPAKGSISCARPHYLIYTPAKRIKYYGYDASMKVDGKECQFQHMRRNDELRAGFLENTSCALAIKTGSTHELRIDFYQLIVIGKWKNVQWDKNDQRYEKRKGFRYKRGKKLHSASITCKNE